MGCWLLWAGLALGNPYATDCNGQPIFLPTTPVSTTVPPATDFAKAQVEEVAAETDKAQTTAAAATDPEAVTENVAVTEPAGLSLPALSLGHMALDWGVSSIGAGTLMPTPGLLGMGSGFFPRGFGNGNNGTNGSSQGSWSNPVIYNVINNGNCVPPCPGPPPGPPCPVPEPFSLLIWAVALGLAGWRIARNRRLLARR